MADFTQTINNSLNVLGASPPTLWNDFNWGEQNWGADEDLVTAVDKIIGNTTALTDALFFDIDLVLSFGSTSISSDLPSQTLEDSDGYFHVFRGGSTNAEDRPLTSYTEVSDGSSTWTESTPPSTTWS